MTVDENGFFREALHESEERHRVTLQAEALQRSEAYLAEAQRLSHTGSWAWNPLTEQCFYWSEEMFRIFEIDPQQGLPTSEVWWSRIHPEDRESMRELLWRSAVEKTEYVHDHRIVLPDGTVKHIHAIGRPVLDANGQVTEYVGTAMDVTERKRAEEALRRSEAYLAEGQRLSHTGSFAFDVASNKYVYLSEECLRIFELDAQEGLPTREEVSRRIHPEDWDGVKGDFEKSLREKVDTSSEFRIALPSGAAKHVHAIRHPVLNDAGDVIEVVGTVIDMTERKGAEEQRRKSAERFRAIADFTYDWENWIGVDGKLLWVNPAVERITGYSVGECMAMPDFPIPIIAEADRETVARQIREAVHGSSRNDFEFRVRHKDCHLVWVAVSWQPIYDSRGARLGHRSSIRDITDRKRVEETLRRSETYLAEAQRLSHTGSWAFDLASNKYVYVSEECFRIFELDAQEDFPNREAVSRLIHPEDWDRGNAEFEKLLREKVDITSEFRVTLPSGAAKHIQLIRHPVLNDAGDVVELLGTVIDMTERKRAEEALQRIADYLAETQRLTHTGAWANDVTGQPVYWSEELFRIWGFDPQRGLPTRDQALQRIHMEDLDKYLQYWQSVLRPNQEKLDSGIEFRIVLPDGTVKNLYGQANRVLNANGELVEVVGTTIDITERKRVEAEMNNLKSYLSNIIDSMPSILVGIDNTRTVTQWNRHAEAFTGIPAGEAIGKPVVHLLPDFAPWIMAMGNDIDEHRPSSMEKLLIEKDGERRFYDLMLYPLLVDAVGGAVLRIEDVTERARIQELMVQTEKMMSIGGLAAGMAHEINNPLGIITQAAHNIERRISLELHANRKVSEELGLTLEGIRAYFDKRQISDAIASIRTASSRAAKIVANMLQFSRRDTTMEFTSLAQIVDQALELAASDYDLKKKYDFRSIEIIKDYEDTPQVPIVSLEIEQVILNLLKNAAQAMTANPPDRRPSITFRLRYEDRYAVLEVEDNGPGMTEDTRRRVFEPFFTTKEPGVGTGLGLSVSYMIVTQNHKGLMEVQSTPGRGTVFKVRLPIGESKT
jgi:PAS domain S-box-containing protein